MAEGERDEDWGPRIARWTFILTIVSAVAFVGAVFVFILSRNV